MGKLVKASILRESDAKLKNVSEVVVLDISKLKAVDNCALRRTLRRSRVELTSVSNSLAGKMVSGHRLEPIRKLLSGPSALMYGGGDVVELAKAAISSKKQFSALQIRGGCSEGIVLDGDGVEALSKSPGRPELLSAIAGLITAPGARIAGLLGGPGGRLVAAFQQRQVD